MKKTKFFNNKIVINGLRIIAITCIFSLLISSGLAEMNNETPNNSIYRNTPQYEQDVNTYYQEYKTLQLPREELKSQIYNCLVDSSLSWDDKQKQIKPLMGWDERLEYFTNHCKINEESGECSYDLGFWNWFLRLFGWGVDESKLPQTIAQGEALNKIYQENFDIYVEALREAGDP